MYVNLSQVPSEIAEFYEALTRQIPNGVKYKTVTGDNGESYQIEVPQWKTETYVAMKDSGQFKSWGDVTRVMANTKPMEVIDLFICCAINAERWAFHDEYVAWEEACGKIEEHNLDVELMDGETEPRHLEFPPEPVDTYKGETIESIKAGKFKVEMEKVRKLIGVEFEGEMVSATKEDMWGLSSVDGYVRNTGSVDFRFDNGTTINLNNKNIDSFYVIWMPFRRSFFI